MSLRGLTLAVSTLAAAALSGCKLEHPPTPTAISDSSAIARALSLASVPQLDSTGPSSLRVSAARIGGSFAAAFEREMAPMLTFANNQHGTGGSADYGVEVEDLLIAEDSAVALVSESAPEGTTRVRMLLLPRAEGGWRVVSKRTVSESADGARLAMPSAVSSVAPPD